MKYYYIINGFLKAVVFSYLWHDDYGEIFKRFENLHYWEATTINNQQMIVELTYEEIGKHCKYLI